jgi:EAL domain-containing protein (putative c-di-GMP-specific phosphodiesterase class I)
VSDMVPPAADKLRAQRDRFVAFAFASADMLLELAPDGRVAFAGGACDKLLGAAADGLAGADFLSLIQPDDRAMVTEALRRLRGGARIERLRVDMLAGTTPVPMLLSGIALQGAQGPVHLSVSRNRAGPAERRDCAKPMTSEGLADLATTRLREACQSGESYSLTLLAVPADDGADAAMTKALETSLRAWSVGGDSVARLENGTIGIIHDAGIGKAALQERLRETLSAFDHDDLAALRLGTMELDGDGTDPDAAKALVYVINKFAESGEALSVSSLGQACKAAMGETLAKVANFRSLIGGPQFCFAFQPIVCLTNWSIHHFEALARLAQGDKFVLPSRFVSFAENVGVVTELDMIVCRKAMAVLRDNAGIPPAAHLAINLSGRSLTNQAFADALTRLLKENQWQIPRLLIEITESAEISDLGVANKLVQKLRTLGCRVCLDDFGAGAATFQYLRALEVDFVKIDGSYILDAFDTRHGKPFLRAMANLCSELGIRTIGEMVEDERSVHLLRELQVNFGQGFYFAKPSTDATRVPLPAKPFGRVRAQMAIGG